MSVTLALEDLEVSIGGLALLMPTTLELHAGQVWAIVGRSGAGKSVLMKAALGLLPATRGRVVLDVPVGRIEAKAGDQEAFARIRQHIAYVYQEPALLDDLNVADNLRFAARRLRGETPSLRTASRIAEQLGLGPYLRATPATLSPGLRRCVALGRALCQEPTGLVLDEPTSGLDPVAAHAVREMLAGPGGHTPLLVVITHDPRCVQTLAATCIQVTQGRVGCQPSRASSSDTKHLQAPGS